MVHLADGKINFLFRGKINHVHRSPSISFFNLVAGTVTGLLDEAKI
ncbi:MAG: hypothetical protein JSU72_03185 [Deltaproteobacteria bacterium]|nr:MAG: hypothetical protein JSU72_03185 [Deltaproteobacteria bacterium]